ncbi:UNKNOWN [Stylonychia lemnae]|uniref:Mitochondrial carrier protein n=1 Tax=Stylonychia lemnae TaxID=5949 RepID=A0A077ZUP9_STYLE|nr:UNKNOWN [Stylonychia lemnae]|eukprot:CDW73269.1 UNKNOWN [Stylonychia lemnae]
MDQNLQNQSKLSNHGNSSPATIKDNVEKQMKTKQSSLYFWGAAAGMFRVAAGFPIEHPIDSIKTQWQAKPYLKNEFHIIKDIYQNKGIKGFYAGSLPNFTRVLIKNSYRYPLMVGMPNFYKNNLPRQIQDNKSIQKLLTGSSIGLVEATLTCPIERIKVYFMTVEKRLSYQQFFKIIKGNAFHELFRGFTPLFMRQSVSWMVFLQTDHLLKSQIRRIWNIKESERIPTKFLMMSSLIVAMVNTTIIMPFDCVKTHMEKVDPTSTYVKSFRSIYNQGGLLGFFTGVRLRFLLSLTSALFTVNILERLEHLAHYLRPGN